MKDQFIKQLKIDSQFLQTQNLMDYSLLIGISNELPIPKEEDKGSKLKVPSVVFFKTDSKSLFPIESGSPTSLLRNVSNKLIKRRSFQINTATPPESPVAVSPSESVAITKNARSEGI